MMVKKLLFFVLIAIATLSSSFTPVSAAPRTAQPTYGIDISYPQCAKRVPTDQAFGIVGVNGGKASNFNACLKEQLLWASKSSGITAQPKMQMYINTGNPGEVQHLMTTPWPTASTPENPYTCTGANDQACSWQYGWERAKVAVDYFKTQVPVGVNADPSLYNWWLDVETMNSWQGEALQTPSAAQYDNNIATLEGWAAYLKSINVRAVGIYSTTYQWGRITGDRVTAQSNLTGLASWYALGSTTAAAAARACTSMKPFTASSKITLTQYVSKNLDYNHSCI
jgi:hypothetical protein